MEGNTLGIIWNIIPAFFWETEENQEEPEVRVVVSRPRI
jgi:hypothetical protein